MVTENGSGMGLKIGVVVALVVAVGAVAWVKSARQKPPIVEVPKAEGQNAVETSPGVTHDVPRAGAKPPKELPCLVDLGRGKCMACKMMEPVLDSLRENYAGQFKVQYIDIGEDPDAAERFAIRMIPTQVFIDAKGKELFRHEGFFPESDIVAKWGELGVTLKAPGDASGADTDG